MKSSKIQLQFLFIYLVTSISFGASNDTIKLFRNNILLSEIDTIENNTFFSINDFISSTAIEPFISEKTEKIVFYLDNKKIKITNGITFLLIDDIAFGPRPSISDNEIEFCDSEIKFSRFLNSFARISALISPINLIPSA